MDYVTTWETPDLETTKNDTNLLALLFFLMGAMNIYLFFRRQKDWVQRQGRKLLRSGLVAIAVAALLEWVIL